MDYLRYMITCFHATPSERARFPWRDSATAQVANTIQTAQRLDHTGPNATTIVKLAPLYTRLEPSRYEIRLLTVDRVQPGDFETSVLESTLRTVSLDRKTSYYAVSHRWDTSGQSERVSVNSHAVRVSSNLVFAMRQFFKQGYRTFWIDSICVNQDDLAERGQQVMLMGAIYSQARNRISLAWAGGRGFEIGDESAGW